MHNSPECPWWNASCSDEIAEVHGEGNSVWALWDVKGGFQNVREEDVLKQLEKSEEGRKWIPCCRRVKEAGPRLREHTDRQGNLGTIPKARLTSEESI